MQRQVPDGLSRPVVTHISDAQPFAPGERLLRLPEVKARVGLSKSEIYRQIGRKYFPPGIKLSSRVTVWPESSVDAYIRQVIRASQAAA